MNPNGEIPTEVGPQTIPPHLNTHPLALHTDQASSNSAHHESTVDQNAQRECRKRPHHPVQRLFFLVGSSRFAYNHESSANEISHVIVLQQ